MRCPTAPTSTKENILLGPTILAHIVSVGGGGVVVKSTQVCIGVQGSCSGILIQVAQVPDDGETKRVILSFKL